jgi:hypothetical protein
LKEKINLWAAMPRTRAPQLPMHYPKWFHPGVVWCLAALGWSGTVVVELYLMEFFQIYF